MQCWGWDECRKGTLNDAYEWINGCNTWYTPFTAVAAVAFCRASSILFQILFIQPNAHIHLALWYLNPAILLVNWCDDLPRIRHLIHIHTPMNALWCNSFHTALLLQPFHTFAANYFAILWFMGNFFAVQYVCAANIVNFMKCFRCEIGVNCWQHRGMIIKCKKSAINFMQALGTLIYGLWSRFNWFCVKWIYASN